MKYFMYIYTKSEYILKTRIAERDAPDTHTRWEYDVHDTHKMRILQNKSTCMWSLPEMSVNKSIYIYITLQQKKELNGQSKFGSITKPISWVQIFFINKPITVCSLPTLYWTLYMGLACIYPGTVYLNT